MRVAQSTDMDFILKEIIEDLKNNNQVTVDVLSSKKSFESYIGQEIDVETYEEIQNKTKIPIGVPKKILERKENKEINSAEAENENTTWVSNELDLESYGVKEISNKELKRRSLIRVGDQKDQHIAILKLVADELGCPCPIDIYEEIINENLGRIGGIPLQGMGQMLEIMGLQTQLVKLNRSTLERIEKPSIINVNEVNWLVLSGLTQNTVYNPYHGKATIDTIVKQDNEITTLLIKKTDMTSEKVFGLSWFVPVLKKYSGN